MTPLLPFVRSKSSWQLLRQDLSPAPPYRLGTSPTSVSQQLASLETALGTRLIVRSVRQFRLTLSGTLFLDPAKQILDDVNAAKAKLVMADQTPTMHLRIASIEELDATVTAAWLIRLQDKFPQITFTLTSGASHKNHDALASRAVDLVLAVDTVAKVDWVEQHPILRDPFIPVTSLGLDPKTLSDMLFVRYAHDLQIGRQIEAQLRRSGQQPKHGFEFKTNQALFFMTAELKGWAITTALAYLGTPLAGDLVTAHPLPMFRFARRLALHARAGALGEPPAQIANDMRNCLQTRILDQAVVRLAFLDSDLVILRHDPQILNQ